MCNRKSKFVGFPEKDGHFILHSKCVEKIQQQTNADRIRCMTDEELADQNVRSVQMHNEVEAWSVYVTSDGDVFENRSDAVQNEKEWLKKFVCTGVQIVPQLNERG